jgi:hypothetical protein
VLESLAVHELVLESDFAAYDCEVVASRGILSLNFSHGQEVAARVRRGRGIF